MKSTNYCIALAALPLLVLSTLIVPTSAASTFQILHKFSGPPGGPDGSQPFAGPILDSAGNLYGTTQYGGNVYCICGTIFKISAGGKFTILYRFHGPTDGNIPNSVLVRDSGGNIYGTTRGGGTAGGGAIFKFSAGTETVVTSIGANFGVDGSWPTGITLDPAGNIYGTTLVGGGACAPIDGCGVIFKVDPAGQYTVLYRFMNGPDGGEPFAGVIRDAAGNLYGTALNGGDTSCGSSTGCGTVYELDTNGNFRVLKTFNGYDGKFPNGRLAMDKAGRLYGTAINGGAMGVGVVFQLVPNPGGSWTYNVLHNFDFSPAAAPDGTLLIDKYGTLWGTTGGPVGTVFKMPRKPDGTRGFSVVHKFEGAPSGNPTGDLAVDRAGNIYGTSGGCGTTTTCFGTVFKITP